MSHPLVVFFDKQGITIFLVFHCLGGRLGYYQTNITQISSHADVTKKLFRKRRLYTELN
jgi:hypothetical protein